MKMEPSTPRRSSRRNSFSSRSSSHSKNPYATSGLDKFSALLAELEEKKQKIYSRVNPDEISLVRFVYKDSDDCVPIVVKVKKTDKQQQDNNINNINQSQSPPRKQDANQLKDKFPLQSSISSPENKQVNQSDNNSSNEKKKKMKRSWSFSFSWSDIFKLGHWRQPCYYLPAVIVLILLFLVFFGRSFAILCTSIGWYIVPTLQSKEPSNPNVIRRPMKKKEYLRIQSDNKMVASAHKTTNKSHSGPLKKHGHKKSW